MDTSLLRHIESIIFATDHPVTVREIRKTIKASLDIDMGNKDVETAIEFLREIYNNDDFSFEIANVSGGYLFLTKGAYHNTIGTYLKLESGKKLSRVALETLSIIAYKQPVTRTEIDAIRGVNSDYAIQKLLDKELVNIIGRSEGPGRPLLYSTSEKFFEYFGLADVNELPKLKDFDLEDNTIGDQGPIMENGARNDESE
ncbi:MAG: SMC-Scp complex subunit ScpB [Saprospiraceae bacterium]|nr:SMC-Scp complex subunit ScpB [Saprospiraceae bacterium]